MVDGRRFGGCVLLARILHSKHVDVGVALILEHLQSFLETFLFLLVGLALVQRRSRGCINILLQSLMLNCADVLGFLAVLIIKFLFYLSHVLLQ